jgi:hypothetical protein
MGGLGFQEIKLIDPIYKSYDGYSIDTIPALYKYADCDITFLGQNIKMKIGYSLTSF